MEIIKCEKIYNKDNVCGTRLYNDGKIEIINLEFGADTLIEPHRLPLDIEFCVVSGRPVLVVEKSEINLNCGEKVRVEKNSERSWKNDGEAAVVIGIKYLQ